MRNLNQDLAELIRTMRDVGLFYHEIVRQVQRETLQQILVEVKGNRCKAARMLGVHRNTLSRMIEMAGLWPWMRERGFDVRGYPFAPRATPEPPRELHA